MLFDISSGCEIKDFELPEDDCSFNFESKERQIFSLKESESNLKIKNKELSNFILNALAENDFLKKNKDHIYGEIISSIIHEISQPLTAITAYSAGCKYFLNNRTDNIKSFDKLSAVIEKIFTLAEHAGNTIFNLRKLMINGGVFFEKININDIVNEAVSILNYESIDFGMNIRLSLMDDLPDVNVNKTHIMQVILNLARNGIEAMKYESVSDRRIGHDNREIISQPELIIRTRQVNQSIVVHVIDKGPGIPSHLQDKILDTCFSTKPTGLGVGLRICRLLIETHGGKLSVRKKRKKGAWFSFTLPIVE